MYRGLFACLELGRRVGPLKMYIPDLAGNFSICFLSWSVVIGVLLYHKIFDLTKCLFYFNILHRLVT